MIPAHINEAISQHVASALINAKRAKSCVGNFTTDSDIRQLRAETGMALYALNGLHDIGVAETLYLAQSESAGEYAELQNIIDKYRFFVNEIINNVAEFHSHQWSLIHFNELCDAVKGTRFRMDGLDD